MTAVADGAVTAAAVTVNGVARPLAGVPTFTSALDFVREQGLTGAKEGCAEGECGACAVLLARPAADGGVGTEWVSINSCLVPAAALDGQELVTAEGLGSPSALHQVQHEMAVRGGSQCGYCTPGFVCSMAAEFYRVSRVADAAAADAEHGANGFDLHAVGGNLCRCTGYRPIRDAAFALTAPADDDPLAARRSVSATAPPVTELDDGTARFVRPASLADAVALLVEQPDAQVVAGSTDWGVDANLRGRRATLVVAIDRLPELRELAVTDVAIELGAGLTLTELERRLAGRIPMLDTLFPQFASRLIRNAATLGGNLGTGSPIGDALPALLALDAAVDLVSVAGERRVPLTDYFIGYRETVRQPGELIRSIHLPQPMASLVAFHKLAKRRFDDISSVAVAFALGIRDGVVTAAAIGLGGVAATPIRAAAAEQALIGAPWTPAGVEPAAELLGSAGTPMSDHRASKEYRAAMLGTALRKLVSQHPDGAR